jgi:peptidoglycan-recognition protein LB
MLQAAKNLIEYGILNNNVASNYTLYGHRQARKTECPGDRLFNEIKSWTHFIALDNLNQTETNEIPK